VNEFVEFADACVIVLIFDHWNIHDDDDARCSKRLVLHFLCVALLGVESNSLNIF